MRLFKRLQFAWKYDFDSDFIVYSIPDQCAMTFLKYEDAKKFSDDQIQYRPKVLVSVKEQGYRKGSDE
jgi:hypothetical protein